MKNEKMTFDWIIHCVMNGMPCAECGEIEEPFIRGACDLHTHGIEKYGHPEFQVVLAIDPNISGTILNDLGTRVKNGEKYKDKMFVDNIIQDFPIYLEEHDDDEGNKVLRVIFPDPNGLFPDDEGCDPAYVFQKYPLSMLYIDTEDTHKS